MRTLTARRSTTHGPSPAGSVPGVRSARDPATGPVTGPARPERRDGLPDRRKGDDRRQGPRDRRRSRRVRAEASAPSGRPTRGARPRRRRFLDQALAPHVAYVAALVLLVAVAAGDYATGPYLLFGTFYLLPVSVMAWHAGAVPLAVMGWNGVALFASYALVALLVDIGRRHRDALESRACTDALTHLANRRAFYEAAARELARAARNGTDIAVIYIDIDGLKERNDTYGHAAGDELLMEFAAIVRGSLRAADLVGRLGGDEFCLLMPDTDQWEAERALQRLMTQLSEADVLPIRLSAGVYAGTPSPGDDVEQVVQAADRLMLEAKHAGKDQFRSASMPQVDVPTLS